MMELEKQCKIELTSDEIEEIVRGYIERKMEKEGYELSQSTKQDSGYWPTMLYRGDLIKIK